MRRLLEGLLGWVIVALILLMFMLGDLFVCANWFTCQGVLP